MNIVKGHNCRKPICACCHFLRIISSTGFGAALVVGFGAGWAVPPGAVLLVPGRACVEIEWSAEPKPGNYPTKKMSKDLNELRYPRWVIK
jgi:hypothetical protein